LRKNIITISLLFVLFLSTVYLSLLTEKLSQTLTDQYLHYNTSAIDLATKDSLGTSLIIKQIFLIRLILGIVYIFVFPIPVWSGFQLETVYHLFKSFNAIFMYLLIPLIILSFRRIYQFRIFRTPAMLFCLFTVLGFALGIASTSLETRHLGAFFVPLFLVALLPDLELKEDRIAYKNLLLHFMVAIFIVHILWASLKVLVLL
jgi:hypothetical protein